MKIRLRNLQRVQSIGSIVEVHGLICGQKTNVSHNLQLDLAHTVNQTKIINQCSHLSLGKVYIGKIKLRIIEVLSRIIMKSLTQKKTEKLVQARVIILLQILRSKQEIALKACNFLDLT